MVDLDRYMLAAKHGDVSENSVSVIKTVFKCLKGIVGGGGGFRRFQATANLMSDAGKGKVYDVHEFKYLMSLW